MDNARYLLALIIVATIPAAFAMWFAIHPFVGFWRRLGPGKTYGIVGAAVLGVASALFMMRSSLVTGDLGTSWPAVAGGLVLLKVYWGKIKLFFSTKRATKPVEDRNLDTD